MSEEGFAFRLHALMRLLVSDGRMTSLAVRQIEKIIPEPQISEIGASS